MLTQHDETGGHGENGLHLSKKSQFCQGEKPDTAIKQTSSGRVDKRPEKKKFPASGDLFDEVRHRVKNNGNEDERSGHASEQKGGQRWHSGYFDEEGHGCYAYLDRETTQLAS